LKMKGKKSELDDEKVQKHHRKNFEVIHFSGKKINLM